MNAKWALRAMVSLGGIMAVLCFAGSHVSAAEDDLFVIAQVNHQTVESGVSTREPVQDVKVTVFDATGALVGEALTDDRGEAKILVPGRAEYTITLDTSTLPDESALISGTSDSLRERAG